MAAFFKLSNFAKFVIAAVGMFIMCAGSIASAQVNQNDINLVRDNERVRRPEVMAAQMLMRGVACETGACFSTASDDVGFDTTPIIDVEGNVDPTRVKPGDVTR